MSAHLFAVPNDSRSERAGSPTPPHELPLITTVIEPPAPYHDGQTKQDDELFDERPLLFEIDV